MSPDRHSRVSELTAECPSIGRWCAWCGGAIPAASRQDAICCSKRCRQARHRFLRAVGTAAATAHPLRLAYADPPYPGRAARYYRTHQDYAGEVDHAALIANLAEFDGWAISTSADALQEVLALCPPGVRIAAWHRGERPNKEARGPLNAWEPVIFHGGRPDMSGYVSPTAARDASLPGERDAFTSTPARRDASAAVRLDASAGVRRTDSLVQIARARTTDPDWVTGAKPAAFCRWLFDLLGARSGDTFVDLFPGSGGVARAWRAFASTDVASVAGAGDW